MSVDKTGIVIASRVDTDDAAPQLSRRNLLLASTGAVAASTFGYAGLTETAEAQQPQAQTVPIAQDHYHPKGKAPSSYTIDLQKKLRESMPFDDKLDFEEARKGFIAAPPHKQIMAEAGHVAWDIGKYGFLLQGKDFDSIHPSLQRVAILNMSYGLYEVVPRRYFSGSRVRSRQHVIHQIRDWLDHLRSAYGQGDCQGGSRLHQRKAR
jgi:hypothetical protein